MVFKLIARSTHLFVTVSLASLLGVLGCGKTEQIQTYTVPKELKVNTVPAAPDAKPGEPTDRMLAAILPSGEQAWFVKLVGPISEVDKHAREFEDFVDIMGLDKDGRPRWKLPSGWKEEPGSGIRFATIVIPGEKHLEITVTTASWPGTEEGMLANVNRWRGQLQLPPIDAKQLPEVYQNRKGSAQSKTTVDMRGNFKAGNMTPPFAGGAFGPRVPGLSGTSAKSPDGLPADHPLTDGAPSSPPGLPAGHPPIDNATTTSAPPRADIPKFTKPDSWKSIIPTQSMRLVEFVVGDGEGAPHVTLFRFPADAPMIADPRSNINRWRGEIGLSPLEKSALTAATQPIEIDGRQAIYAPMIPDASKPAESQSKEATLGAILKTGDQVWFIKMRGQRELVKKHEDEFKVFLKSLKFSHDKEAGNGNK